MGLLIVRPSEVIMKLIRLITFLLLLTFPALAATADKQEPLLIQGDLFTVSVREPAGWSADSTGQASERVNLVLYRDKRDAAGGRPTMRVLVSNKTDEKTEEDLIYDMESYRKKFPGVQFKDIVMKHPEYRAFPRLFYVEGGFYEYVTYLNPGKGYRYLIAISMNLQKTEATSEDLQAYTALVASIKALK